MRYLNMDEFDRIAAVNPDALFFARAATHFSLAGALRARETWHFRSLHDEGRAARSSGAR
jgi:hypothetical protein